MATSEAQEPLKRGQGGKFLPRAKAQAQTRIAVTPRRRRNPLGIPSKHKKPGMHVHRLVITDNNLDNDRRIEEMEELGYTPLRDDAGKLVMSRGAVLMEIPLEEFQARQRAYVEENMALNRRQTQEIQAQMRAKLGGLPLPPGETDGVLGEGVEYDAPEQLIDQDLMDVIPQVQSKKT